GWGIRAVDSSVAIGWENLLSGNPRDLYGVSQLLTKSKPLENRSSVAVPQDAPTLQEAVYIVREGGTIDIAAGVHTAQERLAIYKSVTLRGAGPEQTELSKLGMSIFPDVERVTLSNCAVSGEGEQTGLVVGGSVQVHIEDCTFSSLDTGISVRGSAQVHIEDCTFSYLDTGISARDSGQVALIRSIVSNSQVGIWAVVGDVSLDVNESRISDNAQEGIVFFGSSIMIDHCHIIGNGSNCYDTENFGIEVGGESQVSISYSEISQNICGGINIHYNVNRTVVPEANINHNKIFANGYGIGLYCQGGSPKISLSHNEIFANKRGIMLFINPGNDTI
ncbi:MAG: right-handed parallel beta-helix repeat-containing protein, partial [Deltaproteobacteria bacterium]|nr:right-handed parallel beta-helix repeat-containing protein [Deltaproteobacteria bacterium]